MVGINEYYMINLDPNNLLTMDKEEKKPDITIEYIKELVKKYPNDMDLGVNIRKLINSIKG